MTGGRGWLSMSTIRRSSSTDATAVKVERRRRWYFHPGTNTLRIHTAVIFSAECTHSATAECPAALQDGKQWCNPDFTGLVQH